MEVQMGKPGCIEADAEGGLIDVAALPINNEEQRTLRQHGEVRPEMQVRGYEELYVVVNVLLSLAPLPSPQSDLRCRYFTPSQHVTAALAHVVPRHALHAVHASYALGRPTQFMRVAGLIST